MRNIQLVYAYIFDSFTGLNDIELSFSDKFNFHIKKLDEDELSWRILISKKEVQNCISPKFWGNEEYINRLDLIVGENGVGKSTIMSCIEGNAEGIYFTIYLEDINGKLKWFFKPNLEYDMDIDIVETWNANKLIIPNDIYDEPFESIYKSNIFTRSWTCNDMDPEEHGIKASNKPASIYKFVTRELTLLEKYFPAENLIYTFSLDLNSYNGVKLLENRKINIYLKKIIDKAINLMSEADIRILSLNGKYDYNLRKKNEMHNEYLSYKDSLFVGCFGKSEFSIEIIDLLKMNIYISWIMHLSEYMEDYDGYNKLEMILSLDDFNNYLKCELDYIITKLETKNENSIINIIRKYVSFDFIGKLFLQVKKGWIKIKIGYSDGIDFNIELNQKAYIKKDKAITEIINFTDEIKRFHTETKISLRRVGFCNLSSGEMAYLDLFAGIYNIFYLDEYRDEEEEYEYERYKKALNYLFILDEPEASFHPEWSRKLIYYITTFINKLLSGTNKKCQFIISTHSPFIVSDIPQNYINCISLNIDEKGRRNRIINKPKHSFAANIYEILNDGFFMNAPIGEFAQHKIQEIIFRIEKLERLPFDMLSNEKSEIHKMINMIDDKLIRSRLHNMLTQKEKELCELESPILIDYLMKEIVNLKQEIVELKNKVNTEDES